MRIYEHNEPRFAETITGTITKEYDEALTELLKCYPDYEVENIQIIKEEKKTVMKDLGYDSEDVPVEVPYVWATVILTKKKDK